MALIKCPECNKDVSDKANACIHCGFPLSTINNSVSYSSELKEHRLVIESIPNGSQKQNSAIEIICEITGMNWDKAKNLVEKEVVIVKENISLSEAKTLAERFAKINVNFATYHNSVPRSSGVLTMEKQIEENEYIEKLLGKPTKNSNSKSSGKYAVPDKPTFSKGFLIYLIVATALLILMFNSNPPALILEIFCFVILPAIIYFSSYSKRVNDYNLAQNDPVAYQKKLKEEAKAALAQAEAERIRQQNAPKCPHCNSTNIEKLSTIDRGISVAAFGLASGKIGKQYKCKNCKHMW